MPQRFKSQHLPACRAVEQVALVGAGTIGAGWAVEFLAAGLRVNVTDPNPSAQAQLQEQVLSALPYRVANSAAAEGLLSRLHFFSRLGDAVQDAVFIQESTPEVAAIKDRVLAEITESAPTSAVIASSTSSFTPTRLQRHCAAPERLVVGHPFNPVYLVPLVEVVASSKTAPDITAWAMSFYAWLGKCPLHCRREIQGHIANRLQEAMLNEALRLVSQGIASADDIDQAIRNGPGRRWAAIGPMLLAHLSAPVGGMREVLKGKFGWEPPADLQDVITDDKINDIHRQCETLTNGLDIKELEARRDSLLVELNAAYRNATTSSHHSD